VSAQEFKSDPNASYYEMCHKGKLIGQVLLINGPSANIDAYFKYNAYLDGKLVSSGEKSVAPGQMVYVDVKEAAGAHMSADVTAEGGFAKSLAWTAMECESPTTTPEPPTTTSEIPVTTTPSSTTTPAPSPPVHSSHNMTPAPPTSPALRASSENELPNTGSSPVPLALFGGVLLVIGILVLAYVRRARC
jgi:LPXTG-motif cell wall-anchored protein